MQTRNIKIGIFGATGRLGRAIALAALQNPTFQIGSALGRSHLGEDLGTLLGRAPIDVPIALQPAEPLPDLFIDVSLPANLSERLQVDRPLVIGTTGFSPADFEQIRKASERIPIFYTPNFSLGIALMKQAAEEISRRFFTDAHVDLIETHHAEKKDAPSGTALSIAEAIPNVNIHSIRSGKIAGEHTLRFNTAEEQIEITHRVHTRDAFARGALAAARFLIDRPPGLYDMNCLLREI
ncbi:MAG: 4-hydroxy-tetrahydrodipicolinate reductase [Verrucomicrobia bacterium]|nr:4-hydroxy-tetrahydrodipicolinate reductase [Verrucomicrobiota bacterium]